MAHGTGPNFRCAGICAREIVAECAPLLLYIYTLNNNNSKYTYTCGRAHTHTRINAHKAGGVLCRSKPSHPSYVSPAHGARLPP